MTGNFDIIIVGAGPGGLACAYELKDSDLSVLLIERNEIIGPKICAGGLKNMDEKFELPVDKIRIFNKEDFTTKYKSYTLSVAKPMKIISRYDLGQYQEKMLGGCKNVHILKGVKVNEVQKGQIITSAGNFSFKYLVGADGSNSLVRRHLGLETKSSIGMYYEVPGVTDKVIWHFNPEEIGTGYIWVFPHRDNTNMGVYFDPDQLSPREAKQALHRFLGIRKINYSGCKYRAAAISYYYQGCVFDNIYLVGDAAGLPQKTTGGGISFAIISGKEIARKILNPDYKMKEIDMILKYKNRQENVFAFIERIKFIQRPAFRLFINLMKKHWFQRLFGRYT